MVFDFNEKDIGIFVTYKKRTVRCYIERLNYNADKYHLYKLKGGIRDYLHCVNKARKLEWGEGSNDDATLLVFDFSATTHTGTSNALKLRMIQPYLETQLYYSFSENTAASGQTLSLKAYLHYFGVTSNVTVDTLLSVLMGPDMSKQFTNLKNLPSDITSLVDKVLPWTMEENTTITLTSKRVVKLASLIVQLPSPHLHSWDLP